MQITQTSITGANQAEWRASAQAIIDAIAVPGCKTTLYFHTASVAGTGADFTFGKLEALIYAIVQTRNAGTIWPCSVSGMAFGELCPAIYSSGTILKPRGGYIRDGGFEYTALANDNGNLVNWYRYGTISDGESVEIVSDGDVGSGTKAVQIVRVAGTPMLAQFGALPASRKFVIKFKAKCLSASAKTMLVYLLNGGSYAGGGTLLGNQDGPSVTVATDAWADYYVNLSVPRYTMNAYLIFKPAANSTIRIDDVEIFDA